MEEGGGGSPPSPPPMGLQPTGRHISPRGGGGERTLT